ncbi:MAG: 5-(carboxyamino)imidazole ribonucleotide synthase [Alphaproteobacteria bacterium]|nr:5-(carboxyamino)imidazole ribonucleotide synthase [Alphaproteobacteria bacterium]
MTRTLGILGGGQLGRMSALAAARLGIEVHIFTPEENSPASKVAARTIVAPYDDKKALRKFAAGVDVISYEFENIPVESVRTLQKLVPVYPDDNLLEISQHRAREKKFLNDIGIPTAQWAQLKHPDDIHGVLQSWGASQCILKTSRFGYDGKGQVFFRLGDDIYEAWAALNTDDAIAEEVVDFECEISMIIARDKLAQTAVYGPSLNEHRNHILFRATVPAPIPEHLAAKAREMTEHLASAVDLIGVMALEMFLTKDVRVLANEIAPRTHNSGHWTIDACACSQFENHVRTVCGLNVGYPARHSDAVMVNLIGEDIKQTSKFLEIKNACVHDYGKGEVREGRKMGHITVLKAKNEEQPDFNAAVRRLTGNS